MIVDAFNQTLLLPHNDPVVQIVDEDLIACMWRFTKNNGITEGFHTKMELIQRRAYGFKNFTNYRLRVTVAPPLRGESYG
jgi:hypothetical protein